jgi:hypothetical protein
MCKGDDLGQRMVTVFWLLHVCILCVYVKLFCDHLYYF